MRLDAALPFDAEQHRLGVSVRRQLRPSKHLSHVPALHAHAAALERGFRGDRRDVAPRLEALRERLRLSPLYRARLEAASLSPNDLQRLEDLPHFPTLGREELGAHWSHAPGFALREAPGLELAVAISSGSTGQAVPVVRTGYDVLHMYAALPFWLRALHLTLPERPRLALLCALPSGLEYSSRLPHFANGALHRISVARPHALERLRSVAPSVIFSDPAGLHWLAGQRDPPQPLVMLTSAQHFAPAQRSALAARLATPVINYYATTETGPIAWECLESTGCFHTLFPDVWVEDDEGEVLVTRLRDSALPLLRYRPGDRARVEEGSCRCGFHGRSLVGFEGRRACSFVAPTGAEVDAWSLIWLFKDLPLVGFQLVQVGTQGFRLAVDGPLPMTKELLAERLTRALRRLGWETLTVDVVQERLEPMLKPAPFVRRIPEDPGL